jgi:hypothetical protein
MQARLGEAGAASVVPPKQLDSVGPEGGQTGAPGSATASDDGEPFPIKNIALLSPKRQLIRTY